jgi:hypothetical protein
MNKTLIITFALLSGLLIFSCKKKNKFTPTCDGSAPTYTSYVSGIISSKCLSCHGSGSADGDYSTYAKLSAITTNGKFEKEVLTNQTMPKGSTLSEADMNKLKCWVENGFPEN